MQEGWVSRVGGGWGGGPEGEGEVQNLSWWLLFSNDLFNNYLCNQRSKGPGKVSIQPSIPHQAAGQPEQKVNKMPLALCSTSQTMAGLSCWLTHTHIKVRFPGKNFNRQIRGSD